MKNSVSQRIKEFAKLREYSGYELSRRLGYDQPQKINRILKDTTLSPSVDTLQDFARVFPEVSLRWLLTGDGQMFLNEKTNILEEPATIYNTKRQPASNDNQNILQLIEYLKQALNDKEKIIKLLEEKLAARR